MAAAAAALAALQGLGNQPQQACQERVPCVVLLSRVAGAADPGSPAHATTVAPGLEPREFLERK